MTPVSPTKLRDLRVAFSTAFQSGFKQLASQRDKVASTIPSTSRSNVYGWLGELPGIRKWIGDRVIHSLKEHDYTIENEDYEETISVPRNDIDDDNLSSYGLRFQALGDDAAKFPETLVWDTLKAGWDNKCYDGQPFFDTDHPVIDENGETITVANTNGGTGEPWFLIVNNGPIKPIILQERKKFVFTSLDKENDPNVFFKKTYIHGVDGRYGAGYSFWQLAFGSKQTLDADGYKTARTALSTMKKDGGAPMGLTPNLLVVGPSNEDAARKLLNSDNDAGGETNQWKGTAELLVVPWLG